MIFIDIETVPSMCLPTIAEVKPPASMSKPETIKKWFDENSDAARWEMYRKQALDSMRGEILCIGFAVDDGPVSVVDSLTDMFDLLIARDVPVRSYRWCGHNARKFDMKWIYRHAIRDGLMYLAKTIDFNRYKGNIVDTMEMWSCDDYQAYTKLDDIARFLGVGGKSVGIDGSKVFDFVMDGRVDEVKAYCANDVELVRSVYLKLAA